MGTFNFSVECNQGVELGCKRLKEASSFSDIFSEFNLSYSHSLSACLHSDVSVETDDSDLWKQIFSRRRAMTRAVSGIRPQEGPERKTIVASLKRADGSKRTSPVFDYVRDRLTGFPCSIEYNGKTILCNTKDELVSALKSIPNERSAYVLKGLGFDASSCGK